MKDGFSYRGAEAELLGGSFGRRAVTVQSGKQYGNVAGYIAADALNDKGWRDRSESRLRRLYADIGARGENSEFHLSYTGASNLFGAAAATPVEMLNRRWASIYTTPQTYKNQLNFLNATGSYDISDRLNVKGVVYYRGFRQKHVDGNTSEVLPCDPALFPGLLCLEEDDDLLFGQNGPVPQHPQRPDARLDRPHPNQGRRLSAAPGSSPARTRCSGTTITSSSASASIAAGSISARRASSAPSARTCSSPAPASSSRSRTAQIAPVSVLTTNTYTGLYATNTIRPDVAAFVHRRRALQSCLDPPRRPARHRAQRRARIPPLQSGRGRDLQDHAAGDGLCRLFGIEPRADAVRARLRRSGAAVPARQFPGLRSAAEAGGGQDLGSGPARQPRFRRQQPADAGPSACSAPTAATTSWPCRARSPAAACSRTSAPRGARASKRRRRRASIAGRCWPATASSTPRSWTPSRSPRPTIRWRSTARSRCCRAIASRRSRATASRRWRTTPSPTPGRSAPT